MGTIIAIIRNIFITTLDFYYPNYTALEMLFILGLVMVGLCIPPSFIIAIAVNPWVKRKLDFQSQRLETIIKNTTTRTTLPLPKTKTKTQKPLSRRALELHLIKSGHITDFSINDIDHMIKNEKKLEYINRLKVLKLLKNKCQWYHENESEIIYVKKTSDNNRYNVLFYNKISRSTARNRINFENFLIYIMNNYPRNMNA